MSLVSEVSVSAVPKKIHDESWFIWLCFALLPPVGLFLIWKKEKYNLAIRIVLSVSGVIWFFIGIIFYSMLSTDNKKLEQLISENAELAVSVGELELANKNLEDILNDNNDTIATLKKELALLSEVSLKLDMAKKEIEESNEKIKELQMIIFELEAKDATATKKEASTPSTQKEETSETEEAPQAEEEKIVYWVANGKSYHYSENCATLKRSKTIHSGTQAKSGKFDPCNVCANG